MTSVVRLRIRHPGAYFRKVSDWNVARRSWPEHRGSFQAVGACRERIHDALQTPASCAAIARSARAARTTVASKVTTPIPARASAPRRPRPGRSRPARDGRWPLAGPYSLASHSRVGKLEIIRLIVYLGNIDLKLRKFIRRMVRQHAAIRRRDSIQ
jgi:hypothetical protein